MTRLLGLFDVYMLPLCGEGRNAYQPQQKAIMKQERDMDTVCTDPGFLEEVG